MLLNGLQFACDECDCHAPSSSWKLGFPEYYQIAWHANTLGQLLRANLPLFLLPPISLVENFRLTSFIRYRRDEVIRARSEFPSHSVRRMFMCVIYQAEATWRTCVKSSSSCEASRIKLQCYNQLRYVRRIRAGGGGTWKRPKGLAYSDGISVNSGVDRPRQTSTRIFTPSTFAPQLRGLRELGKHEGKEMAPIHRTNQTIGTLYHFASPAALRMDGDRELKEEGAKGRMMV